MHIDVAHFGCRVLCAEVVSATSSENVVVGSIEVIFQASSSHVVISAVSVFNIVDARC